MFVAKNVAKLKRPVQATLGDGADDAGEPSPAWCRARPMTPAMVDLSDPTAPVEVGSQDILVDAWSFFVSGGPAFVVAGESDLLIMGSRRATAPAPTLTATPEPAESVITFPERSVTAGIKRALALNY